jgi:hypothetical protein
VVLASLAHLLAAPAECVVLGGRFQPSLLFEVRGGVQVLSAQCGLAEQPRRELLNSWILILLMACSSFVK